MKEIIVKMSYRVSRKMKDEILAGEYGRAGKLASERDLCSKYGVSRPTIREALAILTTEGVLLREGKRGVTVCGRGGEQQKPEIKQKVMYIRWFAEALCYYVGNGFSRAVREFGDDPLIVDAMGSHQKMLDAIRHPPAGIEGLLLLVVDHPVYEGAIKEARSKGLKLVFVDRVLPGFDFSSVTVDNFGGGYQATDHLVHAHNRPVYYVGSSANPSTTRDRYRGWVEAMRVHGFSNWQDYIWEYPSDSGLEQLGEKEVNMHQHLRQFFREKKESHYSIFTVNDTSAGLLYTIASEFDLKVGKEVFVVGFDDLPLCKRLDPMLSSVYQPQEQLGYEGARLLYEELASRVARPIHKVLPVELKIRASSTGSSP
jgi:LacI family transcriptional regulator